MVLLLPLGNVFGQEINKYDSLELFKMAEKKFASYEKEHGKFLQTKNANIHYLKWENEGAIPLVWNHGRTSSAYELIQVIDDLLEMGFEVYSIDLYAHGQSSTPSNDLSLWDFSDDVIAVMDENNIDKAVVGGWSMGGYVSSVIYDQYPDRILGLILEDGSAMTELAVQVFRQIEPDSVILKKNKEHYQFLNNIYNKGQFKTAYEAFNYVLENSTLPKNLTIDQVFIGNNYYYPNGEKFELVFNRLLWFEIGLDSNFVSKELNPAPNNLNLFHWSTMMLNPDIIFRNLRVPVLIIDPYPLMKDELPSSYKVYLKNKLTINDQFKNRYPELVHLKRYNDAPHGYHLLYPEQFVLDVGEFISIVKQHHNIH